MKTSRFRRLYYLLLGVTTLTFPLLGLFAYLVLPFSASKVLMLSTLAILFGIYLYRLPRFEHRAAQRNVRAREFQRIFRLQSLSRGRVYIGYTIIIFFAVFFWLAVELWGGAPASVQLRDLPDD